MTDKERNSIFYVCTLVEYIARKTLNRRKLIVQALGKQGLLKQLHDAEVNHCLSFEQVSDEIVDYYKITPGDFDTISECPYTIPDFQDIGGLYSILVENCTEKGKEAEEIFKIFSSFLSDEISDFKTGLYYQNPNYLECCYREGYLLS